MSGSDPKQDGGDFDWSYQSIRPSVKYQGVNSLPPLLSPSKDLAWVGRRYGSPMLRLVCVAWLFVNGCIQTNDRHLHAAPSQIPQGFAGASANC